MHTHAYMYAFIASMDAYTYTSILCLEEGNYDNCCKLLKPSSFYYMDGRGQRRRKKAIIYIFCTYE